MSIWNESYPLVLVGTQVSGSGTGQNPNTNLTNGFITAASIPTSSLKNTSATASLNYGLGSFGLFDPTTFLSKSAAQATNCCPLILAGASVFSQDKIGPFHGGYKESVKSKPMRPKNIKRFVRIDTCQPQAQILHLGTTKYTKSLSPTRSDCAYTFYCGETYTLNIEVKGAPALRFLNHQAYRSIDAYTGCCPAGSPTTIVDSTLVMIAWADAIVKDPILQNFIDPIVYTEAGTALYKPGTSGQPTWDTYSSSGHVTGKTAGLRLQGAYQETTFGTCSFERTDNYNVEPVLLTAQLIDYTGNPCSFTGLCAINECNGLQVMGTGESAVRDLIMSESYRQNFFPSVVGNDPRIREVTLGNDMLNAVSRSTLYTQYYIEYIVPREDNPSQTYDNDRYRVSIITSGTNTAFESFMATWLSSCGDCVSLETIACNPCSILTP